MKKYIKLILKYGLIVLVVGFVLIQLVPYGRSHTNPPVVKEPNWDSPQTRALAKSACFDCHSNETVWPWYSNLAPVSWLVQSDVEEGRRYLNFSEWGRGEEGEEGEEAEEWVGVIRNGEMPPAYFVLMHSEARLSDSQKQELIHGLMATR